MVLLRSLLCYSTLDHAECMSVHVFGLHRLQFQHSHVTNDQTSHFQYGPENKWPSMHWGKEKIKTLVSPRPESLYDEIINANNAYHFVQYHWYCSL
jgi:hypothetical protein